MWCTHRAPRRTDARSASCVCLHRSQRVACAVALLDVPQSPLQAPPLLPPLMDVEAARTAALQVLAGGGVGAAWGALSAYLKGLPVPFFVSAYGVNAAVFTAAFLGSRSLLVSATTPAHGSFASDDAFAAAVSDARRWATAGAGALSGGVMTGFVGGPRQGVLGAVLWGAVAMGGAAAVDRVAAWRADAARQLAVRDALWAALPRHAQAGFGAAGRAADGAPLPPPPLSQLPALVQYARDHGLQASEVAPSHGTPPPLPPPSTAAAACGAWDWLPIHVQDSNEVRLRRLRARLADIDETLGLAPPRAAAGDRDRLT